MADLLLDPAGSAQGPLNKPPTVLARKNGIDVVKTNRGGGITYHGPGQCVVYFCVDALRLHAGRPPLYASWSSPLRFFVWALEESILTAVRDVGVQNAFRDKQFPGIWTPHGKVGFIGVAFSKWVSMHGLAVNVWEECEGPMRDVVMCEKHGDVPTSVQREIRRAEADSRHHPIERFPDRVIENFLGISGWRQHGISVIDLADRPRDHPDGQPC